MISQKILIDICSNQHQPVYLTALIGFSGVILGAIISAAGNFITERFRTAKAREADKKRMALLESMLSNEGYEWRKLSTLASVIGLDEVDTKNLLILIGARASETNGDTWGLISRNPLPIHDK